jgi:CP family cyanate transporter-like MFS transporter
VTPATRQRAHSLTVLVLAVAVVALNLRPGATSVGPVLEEVRAGLSMGAGTAGILTALPPLCFGLGGAVAVALARRVGLTGGIALGLVAATVAILLRVVIGSEVLFLVLTVVALLSMALGNVLVPAWIKHDGAGVEVTLMTIFGTGLVAGGSLGALVTAPVAEGSGGWRVALGGWGVLLALALPIWIWLAVRERGALADRSAPMRPPSGRIASSPTAVAMTALFGMQSMHAYIQFGWLPQIYRDSGLSATHAGALQALVAGVGIVGSLLMPTVAARSRSLTPYVAAFGVLLVGGYLGLLLAPTTLPWLWAVLLGVSGFAFPLTIALITARTRDPGITAQLSGFVQPVGYLLAAMGPFAVGLIHQATGGWDVVLVILMVTAVPFTWAGLRVARPVYVDDELD